MQNIINNVMKYNVKKILNVILRILILLLTIYLLYIQVGILLNGMINITYEVVSIDDLKFVVSYSKILIIYFVLITLVMIYRLVSYCKRN